MHQSMKYRRLIPYPIRYMVALLAWVAWVSGDLLLRIAFLPLLPWIGMLSAFGLAHTQETAQLHANLCDFYTRRLLQFPKWRRSLRHRPGNGPTGTAVAGHSVPLEEMSD